MDHSKMVLAAAVRINNARGFGDIRECRIYVDGRVELTIRRPHLADSVRKARIRNGRLFFAGTSTAIKA